jgi:transposase-like protein
MEYAGSGLARGHQRYRCRGCGCHFTDTPLRGKPAAMKALAVLLYGMGNMSFSMIGRLLGVSDVAGLKWVRAEASALPEPEVPAQVVTVEVDEMWHFIKKVCQAVGLARL